MTLGGVIWFQRRDQQRVEVKLNKISNQVEVLEAFSQRIFHSIEAEDILWGIAAQSVESLELDQCAVYTRSDVSQSWECRAVAQANKPIEREAHEVTGFALDEGIIGRAGMRGAVEVDKPAQPLPMHDGEGLKASVMAIPIVCDGKVIGVLEAAMGTHETSMPAREKSCPTWRTSWARNSVEAFLSARRWNSRASTKTTQVRSCA